MNEKQLEDGLHTWPLAAVPTGFSASVMERIKSRYTDERVHERLPLKFRLTWMDYALGLFLSMLPVLGFFAFGVMPRKLVLYLKYQWLVFRFPANEPILIGLMGGIALLLLLTFALSLRYLLPRRASLF